MNRKNFKEEEELTNIILATSHRSKIILDLLLDKGIITKEEFNDKLSEFIDERKNNSEASVKLIDELKEQILIK